MTIKVLVISNYNSSLSSRPEAEIFLGLKKMGLEITIMTPAGSMYAEKFFQAGIKVIDFLAKKKFDRKEIAFIRSTIIEGNFQLLHLFNSKSIINGIRAARGLDVKVVLYRGFTGNIYWYDPSAYLKYLNPRVDGIFCNSQSVKDQIDRQLFFDKSKTIKINKGHSIDWYKDTETIPLENIPSTAFLMCCTVRAQPMKGIKYLIQAMNLLPVELPIHLLILGGRKEYFEKLKGIKNSPNKEKIHILGYRQDLLNVVAGCKVFVSSSIKGESITKSVIEGMCLGLAPLITDIPGNVELHIKGAEKLVVPSKNPQALADGMIYLYENPDLCEKWGKEAKKHIDKNLNHKDTVQKTFEMYKNLIS
ncbi:MAG: glycosyltransferase family 4 protein [Bacteroidetes bacterium]|nr:glycosyltransferase family 4 protein [Bacteroidota bacterium]